MIPPGAFPRLTPSNHRITSPASRRYNCVAWAAGDQERWWWPDELGIAFWPERVPRKQDLDTFIAVFRTLGFETSEDAEFEAGFERVAIYATNRVPTHVARQLPGGRWSSKLGPQEDIEHDLDALAGPAYGSVAVVLQRPTPETA
jgi:hypothetical protein